MQFLWPWMLALLLFVPILALLYILSQRRRQRYALRYASLSLVREAVGSGPGRKRHVPPALFLLSLTAMIVALARPVALLKAPSEEGTVILTIDVSGSMIATDLQPSRIEAAKAAARAFVERQPSTVQIGVVSFTDTAFVVQAPTSDQQAVIAAINRLQPQRGTAIGRGLLASLDAIAQSQGTDSNLNSTFEDNSTAPISPSPTPMPKGQYAPAIVILLTDGENNMGPDPLEAAQLAADRGIRVYTVGIGSSEGTIVRIQGRAIRTRLDEDLLKSMSQTTDANYYNAASEQDLQNIYENLSTRLVLKTEKTEISAPVTGIAIILSLLGGFLSLLWFNRLP